MATRTRGLVALVAALGVAAGALAVPAAPMRAAALGFSISPASLAFGDVASGAAQADLAVTLTNDDGVAHTVGTAAVSGANAADFSIVADTCSGASVDPAGTCSLTVRFRPAAAGARAGSLDLPTNDATGTHHVALTGNGIAGLQVPASRDFGTTQVFGSGVSGKITVRNAGAATFQVTSDAVSGPNAGDFTITGHCTGVTLAPSTACDVTVKFVPQGVGARSATLVLGGPAPFATVPVALTGTGTSPTSPVSWSSIGYAGPSRTWNWGSSLARTVEDGNPRIHLVYATDRVGGKAVGDSGPYLGVYYVRSTAGTTWSSPVRVNGSKQHAERPAIAASGSRVYVTYVSQTKTMRHFKRGAPRVLYVRVNTSHGTSGKWAAAVRLTSTSGRVDYPTVAADGSDVYVAYTDADTGSIRVAASHDSGATWATKGIASTDWRGAAGYEGAPVVAVVGSTVAVTWVRTTDGAVAVRVSTDGGANWETPVDLGTTDTATVSIAARDSRIAVAWIDPVAGVTVAVRTGADWAPARVVTPRNGRPYSLALALQDANRVGVTWAEAVGTPSNLRWAESPDDGVSWYLPQAIASGAAKTHTSNDFPSLIWPSAGTRFITWNGWTPYTGYYRQYVRRGSGTPSGMTIVAPLARPTAAAGAGIGDRPATTRQLHH